MLETASRLQLYSLVREPNPPTLTEQPNALPASEHCPGQPRARFCGCLSTQHARIVLGNGCDRPRYVVDYPLAAGF